MTNGSMYFKSLTGGGTVVGRNPSGCQSHFLIKPDSLTSKHVEDDRPTHSEPTDDQPTIFSGKITGSFTYFTAYGSTWFTGTESDFTAETRLYGKAKMRPYAECGFMKLGAGGTASSLGTGKTLYNMNCALHLRYLGTTGETSNRNFAFYNTKESPTILDGGASGGLVLTGTLEPSSSVKAQRYQQRLVFSGTNAVAECVSSNKFVRIDSGNTNASFFVRKSGPGTWRFADRSADSQLSGVVGVDEGTLAFETIRSKGFQSSLGDARDLYEDKCDVATNLTAVPYAHFVGGTNSEAVFSYEGTQPVYVEDRPLAVCGRARFRAPNCETVKWRGVRGLGADEKTLAIECAASRTNMFADITDASTTDGGEGTLSIVKEGAGDLVLTGDLTFGGDLIAKGGGTLTVRDVSGKPYTYYRLNIQETGYTCGRYSFKATRAVALSEFGLYGADGKRLNNYSAGATNHVAILKPKQTGLQNDDMFDPAGVAKHIGRISDNDTSSGYNLEGSWRDTTKYVKPGDPSSWIKAVVRLGDNQTASSFDLCMCNPFSSGGSNPTAFSIDASADGFNWDANLFVTNNIDFHPPNYYFWLTTMTSAFTNEPWVGSWNMKPENIAHGRIPLTNAVMLAQGELLTHVRSVGAATGTTLVFDGTRKTVSGLRFNKTDGCGTISNFALSSSGTIYVDGVADEKELTIKGDLSGVTGLENAANWSLCVNGTVTDHYGFKVTETGVSIFRRGMVILIR